MKIILDILPYTPFLLVLGAILARPLDTPTGMRLQRERAERERSERYDT